jgi:Na+/H+ antiporter NhaD/arsenite permease-like protein
MTPGSADSATRRLALGSYLALLAVALPLLPVTAVGPARFEFVLFGLTLLGVALFHRHVFLVAIAGLVGIVLFKFTHGAAIDVGEHLFGHVPIWTQIINKEQRSGEWGILLNLLGLLLGFAILARIFEDARVPDVLPRFLPDNWKGPLVLLAMVFIMSSFLDNIAAAMIGGTIAGVVFKRRLHIGYLAAIVAAANAGGAGSVIGDTTTTMMWIDGVAVVAVLKAFIGATVALLVFGGIAARQQHRYQPIQHDPTIGASISWRHVAVVALILSGTIATNYLLDFPALGVWIGIVLGAALVSIPWGETRHALVGSLFLLSLVTSASLMPVESLPEASVLMALNLGFLSSVFDNIPLTKLALDQGGYDWGILAFSVGFGGSMVWFGSSAGVAISNLYPEVRSVVKWLRHGWYIVVAYVVGFALMVAIGQWHPTPNRSSSTTNPTVAAENLTE